MNRSAVDALNTRSAHHRGAAVNSSCNNANPARQVAASSGAEWNNPVRHRCILSNQEMPPRPADGGLGVERHRHNQR